MEKHVIGYFDLLGFSNAVKNGDADDLLKSVLSTIDELKKLAQKIGKSGEYEQYIIPQISTFSDHIVLSYSINNDTDFTSIIRSMGIVAGKITREAITAGCLLRGAVTIGDLDHNDGTIFGQGLIRAYEIETELAHYPRVIVTEDVIEKSNSSFVRLDDDGFYQLDYMKVLLLEDNDPSSTFMTDYQDKIISSVKEIRNLLDIQINKLVNSGTEGRGLSYWRWFDSRFERMVKTTAPYLFEEESPITTPRDELVKSK